MCGSCYTGFADAAGSSVPFVAAGVAVARHRWRMLRRGACRAFRPSAAAPAAPGGVLATAR